ncbi:YdcF family protein [Rhodopirellula halodulae]|uniref:YdcF family protein n=1 Tax=Rhodopirellula halodulae TaxID=2894198 RepID=UPI001E583678|nr:YdcF family protein [Rhodopirellula sp. JC737]MCC9655662.1 YdcF family protein [Rhodopirellula sp. JC737]
MIPWVLFLSMLVAIFVYGNRLVADWLAGTLEKQFREVNPLQGRSFERVILLGGATGETDSGGLQVNENGDRVVMAARLFHCGKAEKIVCTGIRNSDDSRFSTDEAEQSRRLLIELGVPDLKIEKIGGSNTAEEMMAVKEVAAEQPIGVISSAWHLPRVLRLAERFGVDAVPVPCGFLCNLSRKRSLRVRIRDFIPGHRAMMMNTYAIREYVAMTLGR